MIKKLSSKKAFTIIEVVLVLGIAGLIILAVFVAVPALQRSKRDTIAKNDMTRFMSAIVSWQNSHSGNVPIYFDSSKTMTTGVSCGTPKSVKDAQDKGCFYINDKFFTKYIDADLIMTADSPKVIGGNQYEFTCKDGAACSSFANPRGELYKIKAESITYSNNREELYTYYDNVIHLAPYGKCSSSGSTEPDGKGITEATNDPNDVTIVYRLENKALFCIDNQ